MNFRNILIATFLIIGLIIYISISNNTSTSINSNEIAPTSTKNINTNSKPTIGNLLNKCYTLQCAVNVCSYLMEDVYDGSNNEGSSCVLIWALDNLRLSEVKTLKDETTPSLVKKNSRSQIGKKMCALGDIIEIHEFTLKNQMYNTGILAAYSGNLYHFIGVRSSGNLGENSSANFCGIVTGNWSYPNSGGGVGHTIELLGVWDLPENKY